MSTTRIGRRFTRLVVQDVFELSPNRDGNHKYMCQCDCGNQKITKWKNLTRGDTKSCGCLCAENLALLRALGEKNRKEKAEKKAAYEKEIESLKVEGYHRKRHPLINTWRTMIRRCHDPRYTKYKYYGAKGVVVCQRWRDSFADFVADMGEKPGASYSLDRVDPNGNYEPGNCRWATVNEQLTNTRTWRPLYFATIKGKTARIGQWAKKLGLTVDAIKNAIKQGNSPERAVLLAYSRKKVFLAGGHDYSVCEAEADELFAKYCPIDLQVTK